MKKLLYLLTLVVMASCGMSQKAEEIKQKEELKELIDSAKLSKAGKTDLYLGFKFGMTEKEINRHMKKLEREGKADRDYRGAYTVKLIGEHGFEYNANVGVEYYMGKMRRLKFTTDNESDYVMICTAFLKANKGNWVIVNGPLGNKEYIMQIDNILCTFTGYIKTLVTFEDAPYIDLMKQEKDSIESARVDAYRM